MGKELQDAFRKLQKRDVDTFPAKVLSVDKAKGTCKVSDDEIEYTDVQLSSVIDGNDKKFYLFPKVGSSVLVSPINEDLHRLYVEAYSEIESLSIVVETVKFQMDAAGFLLKKENETLKALMVDLIEEIKKMKFTTNNGPTINLINTPQFTAIGDRFKNFLKDS
jgi:phage baseplate assembly protein gpV